MTWSSLNSLSFFNTAAIFGSIRPCNQSVFLKQQIIIFQFSKSTLHVRMVEQIVESVMVAHKDSVQVESPQPKHSPDLVLLVQLPKSSHWVSLELFDPDQLEEVAKLKVSSDDFCLISKSYQRQTNARVWQKKPFPVGAKFSQKYIYCKHCTSALQLKGNV